MTFTNDGPVAAITAARNYVASQGIGNFPEEAQARLMEFNGWQIFEAITNGMELFYALLMEFPDAPARDDGLNVLGSLALYISIFNTGGKAARALEIQTWCMSELEGGEYPEPDVDPEWSLLPPPPSGP